MTTVIIPQNTGKTKELVAVPRDIYEKFLEWHKITKSIRVANPTTGEKKPSLAAEKHLKKVIMLP